MTDNFPFDTAEEFLRATRKKDKSMPSVNIASPLMPDTTGAEKTGIGAALLGVVAFTQSDDQTIQLATIICSTVIVIAIVASNAFIRGKRNDRIGYENATTIESAANIHMATAEEE